MNDTNLIIMDRTREPWTVEQVSTTRDGALLRFRHEMGYELTARAARPLNEMRERELYRLLEEVRCRPPRKAIPEAA